VNQTARCPEAHALPIAPVRRVLLSDDDRAIANRLATQLLHEERHLSSTAFFGPGVRPGFGTTPSILIGDKSEIPLLPPAGQDTLEYRIALLADKSDIIVLAADRNPAFEAYLGRLLGLDRIDVLTARRTAPGPPHPTAQRCIEDPTLFGRLAERVRAWRGATLLPYISTGRIWVLARKLHDQTNEAVFVAAPPPNLAARVNDKLWFGDVVVRMFGESAVPAKISAFGPAALTGHIRQLARKWEKLVIKVPDSAGSAGNFPVSAAAIRNMSTKALHDYLCALVAANGFPTPYPLMVEVWDCDVLASPSVQVWIPGRDDGDPVIEGVYDQLLTGEEARFVGAAPADLPQTWDERLCRDAMKLALLFQHLGYFGRCSFDTVIAGGKNGRPEVHWIECNGRWGGVSLPMTFLNRIFGRGVRPAHLMVQRSDLDFAGLPFQAGLELLADQLYRRGSKPEGVILIAPGGLESGTAMHMIAIDKTIENATHRAERVLQCLYKRGRRTSEGAR